MKETSDQAEGFLLDLEKRAGVHQESSEKLETQLKVLLVRHSREPASTVLVVRIAKTLASCLRTRGDWEQAEQYAKMAANLEQRHGGARQPRGDSRVPPKVNEPEASSSLRPEGAKGPGAGQDSFGQSLMRLWGTSWDSWFAAWDWVLKRERP